MHASFKLLACAVIFLTLCVQGCTRQEPINVAAAQITPPLVKRLPTDLEQRAAQLARALGKPSRLLVGLGTVPIASIQAQQLKPDIYDQYINGVGKDSWINWNSPAGAYIGVVAKNADAIGAVPMFTLYQMAALGDSNISGLGDPHFMQQYWHNVRVLFRELKAYDKPALVNLEPDFWGYTQRQRADPANHFVHVSTNNPACSDQPNNMIGFGHCLLTMARSVAPKAYVGFPPSLFPDVAATELNYMKLIGAGDADFVVMQTGDRDAGCFEAGYTGQDAGCDRPNAIKYNTWDASNTTAPHFAGHLAVARQFFEGLQRPLLWWQTALGVESQTKGGRPGAFRDNKAEYFLTHPAEVVAAGGIGLVFSPGHISQTTIDTDRGQFKRLSEQYFRTPAALK